MFISVKEIKKVRHFRHTGMKEKERINFIDHRDYITTHIPDPRLWVRNKNWSLPLLKHKGVPIL